MKYFSIIALAISAILKCSYSDAQILDASVVSGVKKTQILQRIKSIEANSELTGELTKRINDSTRLLKVYFGYFDPDNFSYNLDPLKKITFPLNYYWLYNGSAIFAIASNIEEKSCDFGRPPYNTRDQFQCFGSNENKLKGKKYSLFRLSCSKELYALIGKDIYVLDKDSNLEPFISFYQKRYSIKQLRDYFNKRKK